MRLHNNYRDFLIIIGGFFIALILLLCFIRIVRSEELNNACVFIVLNDWILHKTEDTPNSKFRKNSIIRKQLVQDLINGSTIYDKRPFMPFLAVFFAYKESSFNEFARGDISNGKAKAHGIMQFHSTIRMVCRRQLQLNLNERYDQIVCFSYWINYLSKKCGGLEGAIRAYTSKGGSCRGTPKGRRLAKHRIKQVKKLANQCHIGVE
jgi:hypothetical protein